MDRHAMSRRLVRVVGEEKRLPSASELELDEETYASFIENMSTGVAAFVTGVTINRGLDGRPKSVTAVAPKLTAMGDLVYAAMGGTGHEAIEGT